MSHILVTGGTGFIGSHTVVELLQSGYEVTILDNLSNSDASVVDAIEQITGKRPKLIVADLLDVAATSAAFNGAQYDGVIHFAGLKAVGESVQKPWWYYHNNLTGSLNLFDAMAKHGCKTLVFSSSATVYGPDNPSPYIETMSTSATNPYGWTKVMIERMLMDICAADPGWSALLLRYFNPIGAHESGLIGENPRGIPNNLVPYIAQVAVGKREKLGVFGDDYPTRDGTGERDYIHVVDLAEGHVLALRYALAHRGAEPINLGTGNATSVFEVLRAYERACGHAIAYEVLPRRAGDLAAYWANADKAKALLGWTAKRGIEDMCRDSWRFTSTHL